MRIDRRDGRSGDWFERPMATPRGPFANPLLEASNLGGRKGFPPASRWGHLLGGVGAGDPAEQFTGGGIARDNGGAGVAVGGRRLAEIQPQVGLAMTLVGTVTGEAAVGQQREHIPAEAEWLSSVGEARVRKPGEHAERRHQPNPPQRAEGERTGGRLCNSSQAQRRQPSQWRLSKPCSRSVCSRWVCSEEGRSRGAQRGASTSNLQESPRAHIRHDPALNASPPESRRRTSGARLDLSPSPPLGGTDEAWGGGRRRGGNAGVPPQSAETALTLVAGGSERGWARFAGPVMFASAGENGAGDPFTETTLTTKN
jgi:hypothetical protein